MIRERTIEVPEMDQELFRLLYNGLKLPETDIPASDLFNFRLTVKSILFHGNSSFDWFIARVNYEDESACVVSYNAGGYIGTTLYEAGSPVCSIDGLETPKGLILIKPEISEESIRRLSLHLGRLALLADRGKLMGVVGPMGRRRSTSERSKLYWMIIDDEQGKTDPFLFNMIDRGVACRAKHIYDGIKGKVLNEERGDVSPLKFAIDEKGWNHDLLKINYSPSLTQKIKAELSM